MSLKLLILSFVFTLYIFASDNISSLLCQREAFGYCNKKKLKYSLTIIQHSEIINLLRAIENPNDFVKSIPRKYFSERSASFENNIFMDIIPAALATKSEEFKDNILADHLYRNLSRLDNLLHIALIDAGAKAKPPIPTLDISLCCRFERSNQVDYAYALLSRGANPNQVVQYFSQEHKYSEKHTPLCYVDDLELAELLVKYGANVGAVSSKSRKTFLHLASEEEKFCSKLLQFYIDNGVDVNAKDSCGSTPLERMVLDQQSHVLEHEHQKLQDKVSILLKNGADYQLSIKLVEKTAKELIQDYPCYVNKYKLLHNILAAHHAQNGKNHE